MAVTLDGVFYCCASAARFMTKKRAGSIVNIANKPQPQASYNASKAGTFMTGYDLVMDGAYTIW